MNNTQSATIQLISQEEMKKQYWEQYHSLMKALTETVNVLTALGEVVPIGGSQSVKSVPRPLNMTALVKEACMNLESTFTREDVINYILKVAPDRKINPKSISAMISNMCSENGLLKIVESGAGGTLGVYRLNPARKISSSVRPSNA